MEQGVDQGSGPAPVAGEPRKRYRYRSPFWAIVLIGLGVVWLLFNADAISAESLGMLSVLWPVLLIGIGADLLIGHRSLALGGAVGVVTVGLIIVLMVLGPTFGWAGDTSVKTQTFSASVGQATSARVSLETGGYSAAIHALQPSTSPDRPLLSAAVTYRGSVDFQSSGDAAKDVSIKATGQSWWWQWLDDLGATPWDIGLDPGVPLDLKVDSVSGSSDLDLAGMRLADLEVDMSSGSTRLILPAAEQSFGVKLHLSSGDLNVEAPAGARADMSIDMSSGDASVVLGAESDATISFDGSSGEFAIDLPAGQALRVEVKQVSSGDVNLPSGLVQVEKGDGEEGIWETQGYAAALHKVHLIVELSSGSVRVRLGG
ncbi:MAG: hypothetical protein A2133_10065 [Actinobacteria bacterium RBG_16_64_13]|nr:MAG: hypothetical protein A2133_10065 [Actinobacteria bacterium RBG_16_64_13]